MAPARRQSPCRRPRRLHPQAQDPSGRLETPKEQAQSYCFDLVRAGDKDRFLSSLFAPEPLRPHLLALYALNIELSRIRETVSQPGLGEIRLQWWLDAIGAIYAGEAPGHPVTQALAPAIERGNLPQSALRNMIEARRFDLFEDPLPSLNDLEGYLGETTAALIQLSTLVLDRKAAPSCAEAAAFAGVAMGIAGHLRLLPIHRSRGQCYVPVDLLAKHGLGPANLIAGRPEGALAAVMQEMRGIAAARLHEARQRQAAISRQVFPAFLPAALTDIYLRRLDRLGAGTLRRVADVSQLRRQWRLYWSARLKRF